MLYRDGMETLKYKRPLIKLSGEALMGSKSFGIDPAIVSAICEQLKELTELGAEVAVVVGGGNIYRGLEASKSGVDRVTGDQMGMLATIINGLALQNSLESIGVETRVMSAIKLEQFAETFIKRRAVRHLDKGRLVIFVGGTGNPFFTTDTAASLRASEIEADVIIKATRVDGIYSSDPEKDSNASFYPRITFQDVLVKNLKVMDATAISLARENNLPIVVFNLRKEGNLRKVVMGEEIGTLVS